MQDTYEMALWFGHKASQTCHNVFYSARKKDYNIDKNCIFIQ